MSTLESTRSSITRCCASFLFISEDIYFFCISSEFPRAANFKVQSYRTAEILGAGRSQTSDTFHSFGHVVAEGVTEPMLRCCGDPGTTWEPPGNHLGTTWEPPGNHLGTTWEPGATAGSAGQDDYEQMVACQKAEAKLSRSTWTAIQADLRRSKFIKF